MIFTILLAMMVITLLVVPALTYKLTSRRSDSPKIMTFISVVLTIFCFPLALLYVMAWSFKSPLPGK